jgi:hypothetical protein
MKEVPTHSKWRRSTVILLKVYAALCTLVVTAYLGLVAWSLINAEVVPTQQEAVARKDTTATNDDSAEWRLNVNPELKLEQLFHPNPVSLPPLPNGPANGSQPFGLETNRTSPSAGSRR